MKNFVKENRTNIKVRPRPAEAPATSIPKSERRRPKVSAEFTARIQLRKHREITGLSRVQSQGSASHQGGPSVNRSVSGTDAHEEDFFERETIHSPGPLLSREAAGGNPDYYTNYEDLNSIFEGCYNRNPSDSPEALFELQPDAADVVEAKEDESEDCLICFETLPLREFFIVEGCEHRFCQPCMSQHAEARISAGDLQVTCPQERCDTNLTPAQCAALLAAESFDILTARQTEAAIPETEKVYCPFPNCSALMATPLPDNPRPGWRHIFPPSSIDAEVRFVECEECHRAFCLVCAVPWHADLSCEEFARRGAEAATGDAQLRELAAQRNWRDCGRCGRYIDRRDGCNHITCLCGHEFCYVCGKEWTSHYPRCYNY